MKKNKFNLGQYVYIKRNIQLTMFEVKEKVDLFRIKNMYLSDDNVIFYVLFDDEGESIHPLTCPDFVENELIHKEELSDYKFELFMQLHKQMESTLKTKQLSLFKKSQQKN